MTITKELRRDRLIQMQNQSQVQPQICSQIQNGLEGEVVMNNSDNHDNNNNNSNNNNNDYDNNDHTVLRNHKMVSFQEDLNVSNWWLIWEMVMRQEKLGYWII